MNVQYPSFRTQAVQRPKCTTAPNVTDHAELRWLQRSENVELTPHQAWREGYYVGCERQDEKTRLHPPSGTILVEKAGSLITVLDATNISYNADHLIECNQCELEYHTEDESGSCHWCTDAHRGVEQ